MTKLEKATELACKYHAEGVRKLGGLPYLTHLYETTANAALMTDNEEVLAAAMLHDALEDTELTPEIISKTLGEYTAQLVRWCSEDKMRARPASETWQERKVAGIDRTANAPRDAKIIILADKLSNLRSIAVNLAKYGDSIWEAFNNSDKIAHDWLYRSYIDALEELDEEFVYKEYVSLVDEVFGGGFDL